MSPKINNLINERPKPFVLIVLDGWGVASDSKANAITQAAPQNFQNYCNNYLALTLQASGESVGLPWGEMGNSEVGHMNIGAGKIIYQDLPRINKAILEKSFFENETLLGAVRHVKNKKTNLHLIGLLSNGGVHSYDQHLYSILDICSNQGLKDVFIHIILDGRDTPYNSGLNYVTDLQKKIASVGIGTIASISGRFWAMDRDNHWERTKVAYLAIAEGTAERKGNDALAVIKESYSQKNYDEEFTPTVITKNSHGCKITEGDAVIFFNYRADRARQLTKAFVLPDFDKFPERVYRQNLKFVTMTNYEEGLPVEVAFPPEKVDVPLAKVISQAGLKQLHIAETEKYAHVTYFFNGGHEEPFKGQENIMIPSPRIPSYDAQPEMSAREITKQVVNDVVDNKYDFIIVNFANPDMVSHTGNFKAAVKAIQTIDQCLAEIAENVLSVGGVLAITADHGNAECLVKLRTGEIDKEHSCTPVPFILIGEPWFNKESNKDAGAVDLSLLTPSGVLADIAPTILKIMRLDQPLEMTGRSLI